MSLDPYIWCGTFCCRLLAQLNETEMAFDEFWAKHQQKLEQCLQLRHFEQNFREVRVSWCYSNIAFMSLAGCRNWYALITLAKLAIRLKRAFDLFLRLNYIRICTQVLCIVSIWKHHSLLPLAFPITQLSKDISHICPVVFALVKAEFLKMFSTVLVEFAPFASIK